MNGSTGVEADGRRVRILLADGHSLFREAVRVVLEGERDLRVVAEASDGPEALSAAERTRPDVALLDAGLPVCDGIETARMLRERTPDCAVVVVGANEDPDVLERALEAGARGFVSKGSPLSELLEVVRGACRGEVQVPRRMLGDLLGRLMRRRREQDDVLRRLSRLTRREREVLRLIAGGAGTEAIARALVISPQTARTHIQNILSKLQVHSRLEAAALVNGSGVLEPGFEHPSEIDPLSAVAR
ncbi:MAG TPA: response regulator transcription factor [Actinomycetota bacterium]|nr:response regulator transcription factor [Actinomycetota bacterium]